MRFLIILIGSMVVSAAVAIGAVGDDHGLVSKTFKVSKGGSLEVNVGSGGISVSTWDKDEVLVEVTGDDEDAAADDVKIVQRDKSILVEYSPEWSNAEDLEFRISIPVQYSVELSTSAGDIRIEGNLRGTVHANTSGGNIMLGSVGGEVTVETSGGDIATGDIDGDATLTTSGGDIRVGTVKGRADVHTAGGDITIEKADKSVTAETSGGNVHVGDINGDADVSTAGGDIILATVNGTVRLRTAGGNISVEGAKGLVSAKTAAGDVSLYNIVGSVDAKTSAGNLKVELTPAGTGTTTLTTSMGDVLLTLPDDARASVNATVKIRGWWKNRMDDETITSDFDATSSDKDERAREIRSTYQINGGGQRVQIQTSMGNIRIFKMSESKETPPPHKRRR